LNAIMIEAADQELWV